MLLGSSTSPDVPTVSPAGSVVSLASVASTSHSHDGVFLRPGVVTRLVDVHGEASVQTVGYQCSVRDKCTQLKKSYL
jgi:hypothetical protein